MEKIVDADGTETDSAARLPSLASQRPWPLDPSPASPGPAVQPRSEQTLRRYAGDWAAFAAWCRIDEKAALPAAPATVAQYLADVATGLGPGALTRRLAAIGARHRQHGFAAPATDPLVKAAMRAARHAAVGRRRPPPSAEQLERMAAACPGDLAGLRDRALLLLAAAGLDRASLVGLQAEHVGVAPSGATLTLPERTEGHSPRVLSLARSDRFGACPVRALEEWLRVSDTRFGPVFRKIDRWGNLEHRALGTDAVRRILRRRAVRRPRSRSPA